MQCPRLNHFVRFNSDGTVSRCGHMINAPQFESLVVMDSSAWLRDIILSFDSNRWPAECVRCQETESVNNTSIRLNAIEFHSRQTLADYLIVGGVLDNICNSGCLTCDAMLSTKIGSLKSKVYPIVDNSKLFWDLPLDRVVHLDINGGEPSASKNYSMILHNLPPNIRSIRINTNCSTIIEQIPELLDQGIKVTVTVSLDGIADVHDFVRWPIKWSKFYNNLMRYQAMPGLDLNTWTTVSALNLHNFTTIKKFVQDHKLQHSYAFLHKPEELNVKYQNDSTLPYKNLFPGMVAVDRNNQIEIDAFILEQKRLRNIK
jgi:sulfatase maturation enzyme AslB (radical SAM superfamily)